MIGRADIEGSKSNVAMNAWLPQASYPCGNFFDTSSFKFRRTKGSIGHAFTVHIRTGNQNQTSFYPFVPHEISVLVELILGHLHYLLTDVPPQPNSPPDNVFRPDRPAEAGLGSKNRGNAPPPIHGISKITLKVVVFHFRCFQLPLILHLSSHFTKFPLSVPVLSRLFDARGRGPEGPVPNPSPDRHAATRSRRESSSSSPPTADGFGTGTPVPSPQSQSFSRGYGSILPTSLAYIVPSTRGCSPWRPDAVMSTTGRGRHSVLRIFKGRRGRTRHHATCGALPAAGPYLRLSGFQGGQADRLTHVQVPFTWNLSPLRPSKFSFEYLLLPSRSAPTGLSPSPAPPSRGLGPDSPLRTLLQTTIRTPRATDSHGGLFPRVAPPDLRSRLGRPRDAHGSQSRNAGRRALSLMASGATCVQRLDGSRDSAIHTKYRISLRSSSMQEPRYPLPRVFRIRVSHHRPHEHRLRADGGALNDFDFLVAFGAGFFLFNREETDRTRSGASRHEGDRGAEHL
ncbi:hypothetical protein RIF29_02097 [Crotalaria pallida]|uniref:Senescence-associated protein n=1 Tax=Crotalaria pallida TaxID=3830 RepID=A0AAN9IY39_CROPI